MTIKRSQLLNLLREVNESPEIGGKKFESRYEYQVYDDPNLIGVGQKEVGFDLRERDRHLIYLKNQGLLAFDVSKYGEREEFFGGIVKITPKGVEYLEANSKSWIKRQVEALTHNVLTILVSVIVAVLTAWALQFIGPKN